MRTPYDILGVDQNADENTIKRAYRKLASQHHPDKGGDKERFQEIQSAYDILSNPQRRASHDNPSPFGPDSSFSFNFGADNPFNFDNIFNAFGTQFHHPHQRRVHQQARMNLWIALADVAETNKKTISVGTDRGTQVVEIEIPAGINDGDSIQYSRLLSGMDLVITFRIHADPKFQREGPNLYIDHEISVWDLIIGTQTEIRDIFGNQLSLNIPARTQPRTVFRLKGRGIKQRNGQAGDLFVRIQALIPDHIPDSIIDAIEKSQNQ